MIIYLCHISLEVSRKEDYGWYRDEQWKKEKIDRQIKAALSKDWNGVGGLYGAGETEVLYETMNLYKSKIMGKRALVIGSEFPWVESLVLALGAKHVTTLEYNRLKSTHPQVRNQK